jgi:hypothetical protein
VRRFALAKTNMRLLMAWTTGRRPTPSWPVDLRPVSVSTQRRESRTRLLRDNVSPTKSNTTRSQLIETIISILSVRAVFISRQLSNRKLHQTTLKNCYRLTRLRSASYIWLYLLIQFPCWAFYQRCTRMRVGLTVLALAIYAYEI